MYEAPPPAVRSGQGKLIAGIAAGVVALALLGFVVGWLAFHGGTPTANPTPTMTANVGSLGPLTLPDYTGKDFVTARTGMRGLQLGVRLYFGTDGDDRTVLRTEPSAGTPIARGQTVKVYVSGAAPLLTLPAVAGMACNDGGRALAEAGVYPQYPTGRAGVVVSTDPDASATTVRWNDTVKVTCARPGTSPSPQPSTSATSPGPDDSPLPDPAGPNTPPSSDPSTQP